MATHLDVLRAQAGALPQAPGVYFWKDDRERILYIGKAVNLRARVTSYFYTARHSGRTREMLSVARSITCEVTGTELEALFRESALIKKEQPWYNRALRSSRRLWYFKLDLEQADPYIEIVRECREDGSVYFGPFPTPAVARETLAFVHDILPLRKCAAKRPRCKPCIYYQMRKCAAPMLDDAHRQRHMEAVDALFELLDGRNDRVFQWLQKKRDRLSDGLMFEQAAEVQQRLDYLNDSARHDSILRAAMQCRCVLILDSARNQSPRMLLVAHGRVLSVRELAGASAEQIASWVRVHERIIHAAQQEQSELDAASVLQRWLRSNRQHVRWVAIPQDPSERDLLDRVGFVLSEEPTPLPA